MLIVCKTCASSYHIPREILGESGCRLRCVGFGEAWAIAPEAIEADGAPVLEGQRIPAEAIDPSREGLRHRPPPSAGRAGGAFPQRRKVRARQSRVLRKTTKAIAGLLVVGCAMGAVAGRASIVRAAPATARIFASVGLPVNLRGLALDNVRTNIFDSGDKKVLLVEGAIVNLRDSPAETSDLRIALRDQDKRELYVWTASAPKGRLGPNEQVPFRTRLAAPPDGVSDVLVRFTAVGDKLSPAKEGL